MSSKDRGYFVSTGNHLPRTGLASALTAAALAAALSLGAAAAAATTATAETAQRAEAAAKICWSGPHPKLAARISRGVLAAVHRRSSVVSLKVDDPVNHVICDYHQDRQYYSASVVKATILAALLRKLMEEHRYLSSAQRALAWNMITESSNSAASRLWAEVGRPSLQHFLKLAKMKQTVLGPGGYWGLTLITAHDEILLLNLLTSKNSVLDRPSRSYELALMAHVIPSQRWGVPAALPPT